jgi:hypothetical protein
MAGTESHQRALSTAIRQVGSLRTPACIVDAEARFLFVNDAWQRLPPDAGGPVLAGAPLVGASFLDAERQPAIRAAWQAALAEVLAGRALPRVLASEWNDGETARLLSTRLEPVEAADGVVGVIVRRTVARERPVAEVYAIGSREDGAYAGDDGLIAQCACCRRVRCGAEPSRWEFVPRLALRPADAARELCDLCAELHVGLAPEALLRAS